MAALVEKAKNLMMIQRIDICAESILDKATHTALYKFNTNARAWEIYKRVDHPVYSLMIANRQSPEDLIEPLLPKIRVKMDKPYIFFCKIDGSIQGLWFYQEADCERIYNLLNKIIDGLREEASYLRYPQCVWLEPEWCRVDDALMQSAFLYRGRDSPNNRLIKDAIHDGLRAVLNTINDGALVPGAGSFEVAAHVALKKSMEEIKGRAKLGAQAYANALVVIPKTLAQNAGFDAQESIEKMVEEREACPDIAVGLDINSGEPAQPTGISNNVLVKKNSLSSCCVIACNLLLVGEVPTIPVDIGYKDGKETKGAKESGVFSQAVSNPGIAISR